MTPKSKPVYTAIRPTEHENEISLLWTPGQVLVEIAYDPGSGLCFVIRDKSGVHVALQYGNFVPLSWLEAFAGINALRLPACAVSFGSLDKLIADIRCFIHTYFDCDLETEAVAALYVLLTWVYEQCQAVPYLRFLGLWSNGKSRATEAIGALCYRATTLGGSMTSAPLFRLVDATGGTLLMDEADFVNTGVGADIAKILNSGYQRNAPVTRMEDRNGKLVPRVFQIYGPKIINGRHPFKDIATESRCLVYQPYATERKDIPLQLPQDFEDRARDIRNRALAWRFDVLDNFVVTNENVPDLRPRTIQIILPLLTITNRLGDTVRSHYRDALIAFAKRRETQLHQDVQGSLEAEIVRAYLGAKTGATCRDIRKDVLAELEDGDAQIAKWLSDKRVGAMMRNMGFETPHLKRGSTPQINPERLEELKRRFGIVTPASPGSSLTAP